MLANRILRLASRMGLPVPPSVAQLNLGLLGCVRVDPEIALEWYEPARASAKALGLDVVAELNNSDVWAAADPRTKTIVLCARSFFARCVAVGHALRVTEVVGGDRGRPALLLVARFTEAASPGFDPEALFAALHAKAELESGPRRTAAGLADEADRRWLLAHRAHLRNVETWLDESAPNAKYTVLSRQPLRLLRDGPDAQWSRAFTTPEARVELPTPRGPRGFQVDTVEDDGEVLMFADDDLEESVVPSGTARVRPNTAPVKRQIETLDGLAEGAHLEHVVLLDVLRRPAELPSFATAPFQSLELGARDDENDRQHRAVELALATPDACLIHGPPGTGKTTVICELIRQLIRGGKRVLLVAPTHVALDNVLERIGDQSGVVALRLGKRANVDERVHKYLLQDCARALRDKLKRGLDAALATAPPDDAVSNVQRSWRDAVAGDLDAIGELLMLNANLVCATPIGIAMAPEFRAVEPIFDVMIMDEASKATVADFLVPAARARRWVLVGDHFQLSPYLEDDELRWLIDQRIAAIGRPRNAELTEAIAGAARWHHEQRAHPDPAVLRNAWVRLLDAALAPEIAQAFADAPADERVWRARADAWRLGKAAPGDPPDQDEKVRELRAGRAGLVADVLELQRVCMPSVFETLRQTLPADRQIRLNYQHRMARELAAFSRTAVYGGDYLSGRSTQHLGLAIPSLEEHAIWIETNQIPSGRRYEHPRNKNWGGGGYYNRLEIDVVCEVLERCLAFGQQSWRGTTKTGAPAPFEIGIVGFYEVQARRLRDEIFPRFAQGSGRWRRAANVVAANGAPIDLHVSVVDRFQGQEKDVMILSGTRSNPRGRRGHVNNLNRLNVAVTRARHKRIFVGDSSTLVGNADPSDLLRVFFEGCARRLRWGRVLVTEGGQ